MRNFENKYKCKNGDNCEYLKQGICKFYHPSKSYKTVSVTNDDDFILLPELLTSKIKSRPTLYIRHAEKEYKNGNNDEFSLDPDITEKGKIDALNKFKLLLDEYGPPEKIISSPYLRTRATAQIAQSVILEQINLQIKIEYDNKLGECLKNHPNKDLTVCLRPETLIHNPIHPETNIQFNNRIYNHKSKSNTWYITHGLNIYTIASMKKCKIKYPDELCGVVIDCDNKITCI